MHNTFAATICNQLGFTSNNFHTYITDGRYGNTGSETFQGNTYCSRPYNNIRSCSLSQYTSQCINSCNYNRLGLKCYKSDNCNEGDVRLVNGTVEREGRLEVCASGIWGGICSGSSYFKRSAAYVACRQLGYTNTDGATIYSNSENTFGISNRPVVYTSVDCFGNERSIDKCVKTVGSSTCNTVGIRCLESCDNGELRLVGGNKSSEGTVEICLENYWYLVSTVGWDDKDAQVVCRQLKYNSGKAVLGSKYGKPKRPLAYRGVNCRGTEAELIDCSHHRVSSSLNTVVGNDSVAGVNCSGSIGSGIPQDVKFNTTTSLMCNTDEFGLKGCSQVCKESTNDCIGSRLYEFSGHCTCASCASSHAKPEFEMSISLDDAKNYRCDAYCKKMMKNCFDGICDKSKNACVCRYCNGV
jgi:deleted-in-malignant-brain-tumors protein 1